MKKIFFLLGCLFVLLQTMAFASQNDNQKVKAGIFAFDGYHEMDENGKPQGYGIDFLKLLSQYSHLNFELEGFEKSWEDMLEMLKNDEIDIVTTARRTPEREKLFAFSIPIGENKTILSTRLNNTSLRGGDYHKWDGIKIGILKGSTQNELLEKYAKNHEFTYQAKEFSNAHELAQALQSGEVDAILTSNLRKPENEKPLATLDSSNFYAIVRKEEQQLLDEINYAIEQMDLNEGDWRNILYYKNYGPRHSGRTDFTEREKKFISDVREGEKSITITANPDRPPYVFLENGQLKGIIPEYFNLMMDKVGLPHKFVLPDRSTPDQIDIIIDSTGIDPDMEDNTGFRTLPYLTSGIAKVSRQEHQGPIKKVALTESRFFPDLKLHLPAQAQVQYYPTQTDAMRAVEAGQADAAYVDGYAAQNFVNQQLDNDLIYSMLNDVNVNFSMLVPAAANHELITILNKTIQNMPEETLTHLISKYTASPEANMTLLQYMKRNPLTSSVIIFICTVLALGSLVIYLKSRMNKKLLLATEQANRDLAAQLAIVEALSRDYNHVYAVNEKTGQMRIIKVNGYVTEGRNQDESEYNYKELLEKYIEKRVHPEEKAELAQALTLDNVGKTLKEKNDFTGIYRIVNNEGEINHYQYSFTRLKNADGSFILAGFRKIDEMIKKEQEQKAELEEALIRANYANVAKTTFLNNMSHDIRTPMNAIIGFTHLASVNMENRQLVQNYLGKIMTSGNHLLSLINDVLDMSRIESGKVAIVEKEVSLSEMMYDIKTIVQAEVKAKKLDFHINTQDIQNDYVFCDRLRVNQVLINLISNAIKYTMPGGKVWVTVSQLDKKDGVSDYEFRVRDTGIGMSQAFLEHVFEPFEREQTSTVSGIQGTGLGLAITKNIINMMNGQISVKSESGKGSEFIINLQLRIVENPTNSEQVGALKGKRFLIVNDDGDVSNNVGSMLESMGIEYTVATLAKDAMNCIEQAKNASQPYSGYIVDRRLPDMDGIDLARKIREMCGSEPLIIMLTAHDWSDIEKDAQAAGVTAFCSKPIFLSELRNLLLSADTPERKESKMPDFHGKRVLLVDDNEMNLEIGQMILENAGLIVDVAEDGTEAVEKIENSPAGTWELILMDIQMPVMDGYTATRTIRNMEDAAKANIPIMAMTANAFEEDRKEAMNAGLNGYIAKPIDLNQLMKALQSVLGKPEEI